MSQHGLDIQSEHDLPSFQPKGQTSFCKQHRLGRLWGPLRGTPNPLTEEHAHAARDQSKWLWMDWEMTTLLAFGVDGYTTDRFCLKTLRMERQGGGRHATSTS